MRCRWDCIYINEKPVDETLFRKIETHYAQLSQKENINASPFEILTATAFHIFNEEEVQVGVVEVGMGGKLDSTNILNNQVVSIISKIAYDHQRFLGDTIEEIALHKAGILKPNTPYAFNPMNSKSVQAVINQYAKEIGAGRRLDEKTLELETSLFSEKDWQDFAKPLQTFQRDNAILAIIAVKEAVKSLGIDFSDAEIAETLMSLRGKPNPGRLQYLQVQPVFGSSNDLGRDILVDGAHNPDAANALAKFILEKERQRKTGNKPSGIERPVTWVLAMTEGKDARQYLEILLKPGDKVVTTSFGPIDGMPWVKSMDPKELFSTAKAVQPNITGLYIPERGAFRALSAAKSLTGDENPIVLTGSLYLVGDFHRELRTRNGQSWWTDPEHEADRSNMKRIHEVEQQRVKQMLSQ